MSPFRKHVQFYIKLSHYRQANVALNLTKPSETKDGEEENRENKIRNTDDVTKGGAQSIIKVLKDEKEKGEASKQDSTEDSKIEVDDDDMNTEQAHSSSTVGQKPKQGDEPMVVGSPEPPVVEEELDEDIGEIHIVSFNCNLLMF